VTTVTTRALTIASFVAASHLSSLLPHAAGQSAEPQEASSDAPADDPLDATAAPWSFSLSGYTVNPPDDDAYVQAVARADRAVLHLEARHNYEDLHTTSLFVGANLDLGGLIGDLGEKWGLELLAVPMVGAIGGDTDGFAPGLELDVTWKWLEFWSESEYVFDLHDGGDSFFYAWNELTIGPLQWLRFGLVAQRTRVYQMDLEVDRGLMLTLSHGPVTASFYWFNPDRDEPYGAFSLGFAF
jgi:hypothetical protein